MLTTVKKKIRAKTVSAFLANIVVKIDILIKNIGTGGTPASESTTTSVSNLTDLSDVNVCRELKKTTLLKLKFSNSKEKFKKESR